jgi:hypothetical protein
VFKLQLVILDLILFDAGLLVEMAGTDQALPTRLPVQYVPSSSRWFEKPAIDSEDDKVQLGTMMPSTRAMTSRNVRDQFWAKR